MLIDSVCSQNVKMISQYASVFEAARLMGKYQIGCLFVTENESDHDLPIGVITDRDLTIKALSEGADLENMTVADIMSQDVVIFPHDQTIEECLEIMHTKEVRRALISKNNKVYGLISLDDLIIYFSHKLNLISKIIERQIGGRKRDITVPPEELLALSLMP